MFGVRGETSNVVPKYSTIPIITPTTISRIDSGKIVLNFGVMWKPVGKQIDVWLKIGFHVLSLTNLCYAGEQNPNTNDEGCFYTLEFHLR